MLTHNLQIRVRRPPSRPSDLELIEAPGPSLTNGAFLARTLWLALDPFVCTPDAAAHDAVKPGDLVPAHGVGEVIESRHEVFGVGSLVVLECGLQQLCVSDGRRARLLHPGQTPASSALGVLGAPGMAAYFGLLDLARLRPGETVLVSAAADAAGAMAGQIAMLKGAPAIGVASNREGCDWVTRHARLSACINRGAGNMRDSPMLRRTCCSRCSTGPSAGPWSGSECDGPPRALSALGRQRAGQTGHSAQRAG